MSETSSPFFYPVVKEPTGRVQYRTDRAEVVTIDRIGDVRRGQVVSIAPVGKQPTARAMDFARGLVSSGNFSHVAADTPLGVPVEATEETRPDGPDLGEQIGGFASATGNEAPLNDANATVDVAQPLAVDFDFNAQPATATFSPMPEVDAANREHLSTFDGTPESTKKSRK